MGKVLNAEVIEKAFTEANPEGVIWFDKKVCNVSYKQGGKCYSYKFTNLLLLAEKLNIKDLCIDKLDKVNIYNQSYYSRIAELKLEIEKVSSEGIAEDEQGWFDEPETVENKIKSLTAELENTEFLLKRYKEHI